MIRTILSTLLFFGLLGILHAENKLNLVPDSPEKTGALLAERFLASELFPYPWIYPEVCTWLGALRFAETTQNQPLIRQLQERFNPLFDAAKEKLPERNHVDYNMFGALPLELYQITKDRKYLSLGLSYADSQWEMPADASDKALNWAKEGYTWQTRMWIDDMYMITIVQSQAYRATGNRKYIDRAAREMALYLDSLQRPNGLFFHAPDVPFFWGRGNGWMAAGMTELLRLLPEDNPDYSRIMKGYRSMMQSLRQYQMPNGMWNQLVDDPDCWSETSCTAMFTYAMITGVKQGWLNAEDYDATAKKAWSALLSYINEKGDITDVCVGTDKKNDRQHYYNRPRSIGDLHGQAPVLWCVCALLEPAIKR